jgi:hypothetical protein
MFRSQRSNNLNLLFVNNIFKSKSGKIAANTALAVKGVKYDEVVVRFAD